MSQIQCGDHESASAVVICKHLFDGQSSEWCPMPSGNPEANDWLCPSCVAQMATLSVHDLRTVCVHCVRKLQENATKVMTSEPEDEQLETQAIFELSDEHVPIAMFTFNDGGEIDLIGMTYKESDGTLRTTLRLKNPDGSKSVYRIKPKAGQTQDEFVAQFRDQFDQHKEDFPDAVARFVGPPDTADFGAKDVLLFLMTGAPTTKEATTC